MPSRSISLRLLISITLVMLVSGCGAPLSEQWQGYPLNKTTQMQSNSAPDSPTSTKAADPVPDCTKVKCVALTFDDGPGIYTDSLLSILDQHKAKASFFLIGKNVKKHPDIVRDELARGHEIGNHTWSHQNLSTVSRARAETELRKANDAIKAATGSNPTLVRPPYGAIPTSLKKSLTTPIALWSIDTLDWETRDTKKTIKAAEDITAGDIVLMHDIHQSTVDALPKILTDLEAKDYHFVTVSQIIGNPKPGIGYGAGQHPAPK